MDMATAYLGEFVSQSLVKTKALSTCADSKLDGVINFYNINAAYRDNHLFFSQEDSAERQSRRQLTREER